MKNESSILFATSVQPRAKKVTRTLGELERTDFAHWREKFKVVKSQTSGVQPFFVIRVNPRLRIICRYGEDETLIIEDIVTHEGLEKFASGKQRR